MSVSLINAKHGRWLDSTLYPAAYLHYYLYIVLKLEAKYLSRRCCKYTYP